VGAHLLTAQFIQRLQSLEFAADMLEYTYIVVRYCAFLFNACDLRNDFDIDLHFVLVTVVGSEAVRLLDFQFVWIWLSAQ
jgi:hypothetical protein